MSEVTAAAVAGAIQHGEGAGPGKSGVSKVVRVAGVGIALMGSSVAHLDAEIDHGYSPARWFGVLSSLTGAVVAGVCIPLRIWPLVWVGAALQVVALVVPLLMNRMGLGHPANDQWAALKAGAKQARRAGA
jgi:hypothetical protein